MSNKIPNTDEFLERLIRQIHVDGYERGKKQHETPYKYTLPNDEFLKEQFKAISERIAAERAEAEAIGHTDEWLRLDRVVGFTKKRNKAVYKLQLPLEYVQRRTKELKNQAAALTPQVSEGEK